MPWIDEKDGVRPGAELVLELSEVERLEALEPSVMRDMSSGSV